MILPFPADDKLGQSLVRCGKLDFMHFVKRKAQPLELSLSV